MQETNYQFQIRMIGHQMKQKGDKKLESYDITLEQGHALDYLVQHIDDGITQKHMEKAFRRKGSSISSIVTNLEKKELVERKTDLNDERRKIIRPLPKGIALVKDFKIFFEELEEEMTKGFSAEEKERLTSVLNRIIKNTGE
ncbi:MarR family transcriptional regulator [Psychrobacillus glaciei]|uniref:MarR family transcriptional regulator n=1 Tax=Psychrobacillus glaciei TaxID=2283160 RepID=A0A5J6SRY3_9BACI|nr:MarR family transcriptional regulator [Psychrobacillus glaciei]QFG00766.1 MarR family transcriptional regulator [Psychrobacillus glaciei]